MMETSFQPDVQLTLPAQLEALLFVAPSSLTPAQLAQALQLPVADVELGLDELEEEYRNQPEKHGLRLQRSRGRLQLTSAPEVAPAIERLLGLEAASRLSRAALEALAIVAYQQPVTRPQIDAIRGVSSDGVIKSLLSKGLIQEDGRADSPGRPILYSTTSEFLQYFGLTSLKDLPSLKIDSPPETETSTAG
jgi:segregation and condensation protein B